MILFSVFQVLRESVYLSKCLGKKYILTDTIKILENGKIVYRIKAIKNFGHIKKGQIGGWIESEDNLSHNGECWVEDDAVVYGNAFVCCNASVQDNAVVYENSYIKDNALILGDTKIYGNAVVEGNARITGYAKIYGKAKVGGDSFITYHAKIHGNAILNGKMEISDTADIYGVVVITGNVTINRDAKIKSWEDILSITTGWNDVHTFFRCENGDIYVICEKYNGDMNGFICYINQIRCDGWYNNEFHLYLNMLQFVETYFGIKRKI